MSLISSILEIVDEYAVRHRFERVNTLKLSVGAMSCVEPKTLSFAFEVISKGTRAEGAVLDLDVLPVVLYCFACAGEHTVEAFEAACPACGGSQVSVVGGTEELRLLELDVD